jgi:hypothetical protein
MLEFVDRWAIPIALEIGGYFCLLELMAMAVTWKEPRQARKAQHTTYMYCSLYLFINNSAATAKETEVSLIALSACHK